MLTVASQFKYNAKRDTETDGQTGDIRLKIWIRIHSESRFGFTWQIKYNSDII